MQVIAWYSAQALERASLYQEARDADAKDEFLAMLGHELRNPLAPIVTALELMDLRGEAHFARERAMIERQVRHLVRLVDDLLDVSRITRGKVELAPERCELARSSPTRRRDREPARRAAGARLAVDVPERGLVVHRRSGAALAGDRESADQRGEVHARPAARSTSTRARGRRRCGRPRPGHRHRHRARAAAAHLRSCSCRAQRARSAQGGLGSGSRS